METRKNIFYNIILALSQVLFPLITFPYLARTLGPEHIGVINFAESFSRYFIAVAAFGIPIYGVREIAKVQNNLALRSQLLCEIFLINFIASILLSFFYILMIFSLDKLVLEKNVFIFSLIYFVLNVFYLEWFFTGMSQFKYVATRFFIIRLFLVFIVFTFIKTSLDYKYYFQMQVALGVLVAILNFYYLKKYNIVDLKSVKNINLKKHIRPLFILFLTLLSISIYLNLDTVFLGFLSNNETVGYYSSALKLNKLVISILAAISAALFPTLVSLYQKGEIQEFKQLVTDCIYIILSLSLPAVVLIIGCAREIIFILFGENFERSILPLQISSPIILFVSLSTIFGFQILSALSKDRSIFISTLIGMSVSLILSYPLIINFKENGEAIVILITEFTVCLSFIVYSNKFYPLFHYKKFFFQQLISVIPYILIIIIFKTIVDNLFIRFISITSISVLWFSAFHFVILKESLFRTQLLKTIVDKTQISS
jgi:O-antigen/teichoic acid export membrane protein